jgi:hypothetical protein
LPVLPLLMCTLTRAGPIGVVLVLDETTSGAEQPSVLCDRHGLFVIVIDQGISYLAMGWLPTPRGKSP